VASKPGDTLVLKLQNDVKANGLVVLKKGTMVTGVVQSVNYSKANHTKSDSKNAAQSMMEIEWLVPPAEGKVPQNLSLALESLRQVDRSNVREQVSSEDFGLPARDAAPVSDRNTNLARTAVLRSGVSGAAGVTSSTTANAVAPVATLGNGQSNRALLSMPSVVAVDQQTSSAIDDVVGTSSRQLFKVGRGQLVTADGSVQSVDIFSHLNNDTVITSSSKNFEISAGAQVQMLIGVNRK